jgi:hypothetical protein
MHVYRPILTQRRLQRYILWAIALLSWIAAVISGARRPNSRQLRDRGDIAFTDLTRLVRTLLLARALNILRYRQRTPTRNWRHGRDLRRRHFMRSLFGSKLRRLLRHKHPATHIAQLIAVLRNLGAYAAQLARCFRKRRRLWRSVPPIAAPQVVRGAPAPAPAGFDTS